MFKPGDHEYRLHQERRSRLLAAAQRQQDAALRPQGARRAWVALFISLSQKLLR